jgi:ribose/xylose/arabinose/galactoside ABC-type transport system permease subunit
MTKVSAGLRRAAPQLACLAVILFFNWLAFPGFFDLRIQDGRLFGSLIDVLNRGAPVAILAIGMTAVIATKGVDLSVGAVMAMAGAVAATMTVDGYPLPVVLMAALAVGIACGLLNGFLVAVLELQPIVATLILMVAGRGIAQLITGGELQALSHPEFQWIGLARPFGVPAQVIIAVLVAVAAWLVMKLTVYGRHVLAVGGNETASRLAGIPAARVKLLAYVTSGVLAGLVGLIAVSANSASDANNVGVNMELDAIAAVAVAGTPLTGGKVTIWGAVVGAVMLKLLQNTLISHGITKEIAQITVGAVIVLALWLQRHEA